MELNKEQKEILEHTVNRAANGMYCGDSVDMQKLVSLGFMESCGNKSFVMGEYFRITTQGRQALKCNL
jgi:hypothetical protein